MGEVDVQKLEELAGRVHADLGGAASAILVYLGDRLGLYRALAEGGALTSADLAERTGTDERYVREWLGNQAASGYVTYDPGTSRFSVTAEQAAVFADEDSPALMQGAFEGLPALYGNVAKFEEVFRSGRGLGWHEQHPSFFPAVERFFRPAYRASLIQEWIPSLEGVVRKLESGARVADVGCGLGTTTRILAESFPKSTFSGFDYHRESIDAANRRAREAGLDGRVSFEVAGTKDFPGKLYDLVTVFDALHDMGDPVGAARHIRESLAADGTFMLVEPLAGDRLEDNLNPVGRLFYAYSTIVCTPASRSQEVGLGLGAQAGEVRLREVLTRAGFTRIRRATDSPSNMVLEAKP